MRVRVRVRVGARVRVRVRVKVRVRVRVREGPAHLLGGGEQQDGAAATERCAVPRAASV